MYPQDINQDSNGTSAKKFRVVVEQPVGIAAQISAMNVVIAQLTDVWVEYNGSRVNEITPGQQFQIKATYRFEDDAAIPFINRTLVCITAADTVGGVVKNYSDFLVESSGLQTGTETLSRLGNNVMPNHDMNLRFKLWANDDSNIQPAYPPTNLW